MMQAWLNDLNDDQRRAVRWGSGEDVGPLIVLAGPGTGKTRVIIRRVAHLIDGLGEDPASIAAVTFTVKAAGEMRGRLVELLGPRADAVFVGTIHSMARRILARFGDRLGLTAHVQQPDSAQRRRLSRQLAERRSLFRASVSDGVDSAIDRAWSMIGVMRHHAVDAPRAVEFAQRRLGTLLADIPARDDPAREEHDALVAEAREFLDAANLYQFAGEDFLARQLVGHDDSIALARRVLGENKDAAAIMRSQWRHIIVDEFQDTDAAQLSIMRELSPPGSRTSQLMVVGDDDQSIYAFRGADERIFHRFAAAWAEHKAVTLSRNYRSDPRIVTACNSIIAAANSRFDAGKAIVADSKPGTGAGAVCVDLSSDDRDAAAIIALIRREREMDPDRPWESFAILSLKHDHLARYAMALELDGIPSVRRRAGPVLSDEGVQDVMAWARLLVDRGADWAVCRLLARGFGVRLEETSQWRESWRRRDGRRVMDGQGAVAFLDDLTARKGDDPRVARFIGLHAALSDTAASRDAAGTIEAIIRESGVASNELLPARQRARRVSALVRVLKFARERLDRIDQPRDLAGFLSYYDDLDDQEQQFTSLDDSPVEEDADDGDSAGGVQLLTVFAAKGLEFETVFVPRVNPANRFPSLHKRESVMELPEGLVDRVGDVRTTEERIYDEFRRLFYVACTRAKSSLYVLSKRNKKRSDSVNFFEELRFATPPIVDVIEESGLLGQGAGAEVERQAGAPAADLARAEARALAATALDTIDRSGVSLDEIDAASRSLSDAAARLALAAHIRSSATIPAWAAQRGLDESGAALLKRGLSRGRIAPKPPLDLSYSALDAYHRCPACYYLKFVLRLPEEERREARLGSVAHDTLKAFVGSRRSAESEGRLPPSIDALKEMGRTMLMHQEPDASPDDVRRLDELLGGYARLFHDDAAETLETERVVRFEIEHAGCSHRMTAKVDRIDRTPAGFRIIDYKTGGAWKDLRDPKKTDLQMGIYAMALGRLYPDAPMAGTAEYWLLASGQRGVIGLDALDLDKIRSNIGTIIDGILAGEFDGEPSCQGACKTFGLTTRQ
ncbi:MAG: ATP-dependent helicase [Phycisphaerales bacterium]|nr:ATP-dependent helicase [Phycisphaerales bacterium]